MKTCSKCHCEKSLSEFFVSKQSKDGYYPSYKEYKTHLENQFTEQMSWSNYGEWHVDHIRPVCTFDKTTPPSVVNALSNLRPLWATNREINGIFYEGNLNRKIKENYV